MVLASLLLRNIAQRKVRVSLKSEARSGRLQVVAVVCPDCIGFVFRWRSSIKRCDKFTKYAINI